MIGGIFKYTYALAGKNPKKNTLRINLLRVFNIYLFGVITRCRFGSVPLENVLTFLFVTRAV